MRGGFRAVPMKHLYGVCVGGGGCGSVIRATISYVKADIPILVLFRALGTVVGTVRNWESQMVEPYCGCCTCVVLGCLCVSRVQAEAHHISF